MGCLCPQTKKKTKKQSNEERLSSTEMYKTQKSIKIGLGDFKHIRFLGQGAFGKVVLVQRINTQEYYALKSLRKDQIINQQMMENIQTEREILANQIHPFLVNMVYSFQSTGKLYFAMEFMEGGELFDHLTKSGRFSEERAKFYAACISLGLGFLHSKKIVYRDLKLENVLMDKFGYVSLADFGMAKFNKKNKKNFSFVGTTSYFSPEIVCNHGASFPSDWWALGILIYEMIFAKPPFNNQNQEELFEEIKQANVEFNEEIKVTDECKDFIIQLLTKNPIQRLGTRKDIQEIKSHPWFSNIIWDELLGRQIKAPYVPKFQRDRSQSSTYQSTIQTAKSSLIPNDQLAIIEDYQDQFKGFTFKSTNQFRQSNRSQLVYQ